MKMVTLDEVCELIVDCEHKTAPKQDSGYPSIRTPNIGRGYFILENVNRVSRETYEKWTQRAVPQYGDLIIAREAPVGNVAMVPKGLEVCLGQRTVLIRPDQTKTDPRFLTYLLLGDEVQGSIHSQTNGATVAHLNMRDIRGLKLPFLPDLPTQRKIAGILSAYDDLIENNLRRIKILEEMAQSLYREWFVHFRFPGHESAKFVDSALGQIPKGWEVKKLGQVAKIVMGLSPKGDTYNDQGDGMPLVNGPVEFSERFTKRIKWTTSPTKTCKAGDLVVCVRGSTTGKNVKSDGEYCLGRGVCSISSEHQSFVDQMFANELPTLLGMTSGSTFPSWTGPVLQSHPVISPPKTLVAEFNRLALPMSDTIQSLAFKNDNLRRARDLLLPKLLSSPSPS
jgi:type I restriction enzyme S subunit